jgi:hypothetical protein
LFRLLVQPQFAPVLRQQFESWNLDSLGSPASRRVYEYAIDQFIAWYCSEPRLAFNRIVVVRYRMYLESRLWPPTLSTSNWQPCAASLTRPQTQVC